MLRSLVLKRCASSGPPQGSSQLSIPRRPARKIRLGKARPAIYHQFDVLVELSDGSVVRRRSQFPKNEIRLIQDQRNNPLWNPTRTDLVVVDANASGKVDRFKQKYGSLFSSEDKSKGVQQEEQPSTKKAEPEAEVAAEDEDEFGMDDYLSLLNDSSKQIKTGKLATKKRDKK
ncbi:hypothetical protein ZYGR_0I07140 [Zygosaccharomyces rouxii]|uniref:ZYRO0C16874p n=2 Tax=Zygosaccharomyces rouxii TaxID=4956 RepID=C5DUH8_ZYGRC|nr:mitochondrial 54S ribosomal protein YmL36 [Zygosaccharomyces rouxii]KAH9201391.1 mitochondrial 54S ribosomal protein YmL36 [Zygosaccharomyces rouxii]GAV48417.1 hypothetical protein ZYGR_0I07140 [Zygosaccharomyces rouxii]CAR27439.1 ZYRO0C16874p [Zygosaccharomyces rouxii]